MRAYVINLARSADRRAHITALLNQARADYELVTAVDGCELDLADRNTIDPGMLAREWFRPGVVGCALSHLRAYRRILDDGALFALILEDDITVPADVMGVAEEVAARLTGAEVVLLNYDSPSPCLFSKQGLADMGGGRVLALPLDVGQPASAAAYVITREAAARMAASVLPVRAKADDWGFHYRRGAIDRLRCVMPMPVAKSPEFASTMEYNAPGSIKARLLAAAARHDMRLAQRLIARRRELIMRKWTRAELVDLPFTEKPSRLD